MPFNHAIKLPFFLLGKVTFAKSSKGNYVFDCPIRTGMVRIGYVSVAWDSATNITSYKIYGTHLIKGSLAIGPGSKIVVKSNGLLETGDNVWCNENTRILCSTHIVLGERSLLAWDVQLMDSDIHYLLHNNKIRNSSSQILIEDGVWVGNRVSINKGAVIPRMSVVASNTVVNKDFSANGTHLLLAGIPSRVLSADTQ